ncbi:MAG: DNA cytosine methyltransferase [Actinomycetota bacterium]|nr:DNA cytosine methyltransferase [Actinomycetota bacterium]
MKPTSIDLFAGCGGLSLGFERAGFETVFVNELHPVAMQTFVSNRPSSHVVDRHNQCNDILTLTQQPGELDAFAGRMRREHGEIDVVVGGPPCQGFSGIGHRRSFDLTKEDIPSNHLYREMARLIAAVAPRAFVFENVKGLLNSKWTPGGTNGEIWLDVQHTFNMIESMVGRRSVGYKTGWSLLHAKDYGVPQNRPRVILVGIREDQMPSSMPVGLGSGFLPSPTSVAPDLVDLLGDLVDPSWQPGGATLTYPSGARNAAQRLMRTGLHGRVLPKGAKLSDHEYSNHKPEIVEKFRYMIANGGEIPEAMQTKKFAQRVLPARWGDRGPTITATSLADDYVHFTQPRVPTVREWARLQTFPDWYQFAGRRTTGGRRRAGDPDAGIWTRDLPKYTQIGNAVPVQLAEAIGSHIMKLLLR